MSQSRQTKQKKIIEEEITKLNGFFTAEQLFDKISKKDTTLGIATVYRFLNDLKKKNKIYSYICERKTVYSKEKSTHCHFICERTGKIIHFNLKNIDFLKKIEKEIPGSINSVQIEIKGICNNCSKTNSS